MKEKQDKKPKKKSITKSNAKPGEPGPKKKKANVLKVAEIEDQIEMVEKVEHICILCERNRPVFLVDSDDQILRMQERFLPPFLNYTIVENSHITPAAIAKAQMILTNQHTHKSSEVA